MTLAHCFICDVILESVQFFCDVENPSMRETERERAEQGRKVTFSLPMGARKKWGEEVPKVQDT